MKVAAILISPGSRSRCWTGPAAAPEPKGYRYASMTLVLQRTREEDPQVRN